MPYPTSSHGSWSALPLVALAHAGALLLGPRILPRLLASRTPPPALALSLRRADDPLRHERSVAHSSKHAAEASSERAPAEDSAEPKSAGGRCEDGARGGRKVGD